MNLQVMTQIGIALLLCILTGWIAMTQRTGESVVALAPQIEALQVTVAHHDKWIAEWPTNGELAADVKQNTQINYLRDEMKTLSGSRMKTSERLTRLEERQAAMYEDVQKMVVLLENLVQKTN